MKPDSVAVPDWVKEFPSAVTVCDRDGVILSMNDRACRTFGNSGGADLIGRNLLDCHPEPSRSKVAALLKEGRSNAYTIEKAGVRKMIIQSPWYRGGEFAGLVEISVELPPQLPHFVRG